MRYSSRVQEQGVQCAKNRGIGANPQRHREYRHDGEARILGEHAKSVAKVL